MSAIPSFLMPPVIFIGLLLGLWTWKCFWIILMQNKLLYLSWLPPFSRSDAVSEYVSECKPIQWREAQIRSLDGTSLAICEAWAPASQQGTSPVDRQQKRKTVVICYFQGNGGSTPLRLPLLSRVLNAIATRAETSPRTSYAIVALSYRGYWKSSGRATQSGIELDAQALLNWVSESYGGSDTDLEIFLWGHSLGSVVASSALATYLTRRQDRGSFAHDSHLAPISGLIMEAPMSNVKDMLVSLYPQRWLPYRYLWPFSWNTWCNDAALRRLARYKHGEMLRPLPQSTARAVPPILLLSAEKDEVIPAHVADHIEAHARSLTLDVTRRQISQAMHTEIPNRADGREAMVNFVLKNTQNTKYDRQ
ncbi:hypothetical protein N7492_009683 [Penicillium capsulatum]|uniref:AB hydrolase-1 domain-containing protein n=1 Tax=Penicillium capsulatum TaxID=69766 RepID=A0A9W9LII1_9EURO|nr:hypothetical protein N7492_009683 [Penicillium capsulatum]KAJ6107069.1 hypothetical protein N7512_010586 [Penicillium capsulatum]